MVCIGNRLPPSPFLLRPSSLWTAPYSVINFLYLFLILGSISAPYIVDLLGSIHAGIPVVIFGLCSFAAGVTSLMLPETLNKRMPESVADVERAGRRKKGQESEEMNAVAPPAEEAGGE